MRPLIAMILLLTSGCAQEPFKREALPPLTGRDPASVRDAFARAVPSKFTSEDTIVIHPPFHDPVAFLGVTVVDRDAGTFELVGLNHAGVKLLHVAGDRNGNTIRFAIPQLKSRPKVLDAMAADVRNMYMDLVPGESRVAVGRTTVRYKRASGGSLVYELGGDPPRLLDKTLIQGLGATWRVRYYDYATTPVGTSYPRGIVLDNWRYHYRIVIKNRTWNAR
jgi:hypothetical protein